MAAEIPISKVITVPPQSLPEALAVADDAFALVFSGLGPLQKLAVKKLLAKLISTDLVKSTRADLLADLAFVADKVALVHNDPTATFNGWYRKTGGAGAGTWTQFEQLTLAIRAEVLAARDAAVAAGTSAGAALASILAILPGASLGKASDGMQFDRARGESFITRFTAPVDAALALAAGSITFNSVGAALNLPVKLKNIAGTGDFKGCFEDNWEIDSTTVLLAAPTAADQNLFRVGFADGVGRFYGARIQSHPGTSTQLFAALEVAGNSVATIPGGYVYTVGNTIRVRAKRNGNFITITLNWNGGADIVLTSAAMVPVDVSTVERPRLFSVPQVIYLRGNVRTDTIKISHGGANPKLAIAATSLGDGRFTATYGASYAQLIKSAHPGEVLVCAAPGATSANWAAALPELLATGAAEILFEPFANDMATLVPLATTQANVASIVAQCEAVGVKARFLNCPPNNYFAGAINTWLATTALVWFDIFTILVAPGGGFTLNDAYESDTPIAGVAVAPDDLHWGTAGNLAVFTPVNAWLVGLGTFLRVRFRVDSDPTMTANSAARLAPQSVVRAYSAAAIARNLALSLSLPKRLLNRRVMASPPTLTYSLSDPMVSSTFIPAADGAVVASTFNYRKGTKAIASNGLVFDKGASPGLVAGAASNSSHTASVGFMYDGAILSLRFQNNLQKIWIKVDGEYVSMIPTTLGNDQATGYLQIDFGSAKMREIEPIVAGVGSQLRFSGVNIEPTQTIGPVAGRGPRIFVLGDSIAETSGPALGINAYPVVLGDALGCDNVTASAVGGTGLFATAMGAKLTYIQRVLTDVIAYAPDILIISGSPNDSQKTTEENSVALQALVALVITHLPDCRILATSMMLASGPGYTGASIWRAAEGLKLGAAAAGVPFINLLEQDIPADSAVTSTLSRACLANDTRLYTTVKMAKNTTLKFSDGTHARVLLGTASGTGDYICDVDRCPTALASGTTFTVVGNSIWSGNGKVGTPGIGNGIGNCDKVVSADGIHPSDDGSIMIGTFSAYGVIDGLTRLPGATA